MANNRVFARERRLFYTHLLAKAWAKLSDTVNFSEVASKVGSILAANGFRDKLVSTERLKEYVVLES